MKEWKEKRGFSFLLLHIIPHAAHSSPHHFYILVNIQLKPHSHGCVAICACIMYINHKQVDTISFKKNQRVISQSPSSAETIVSIPMLWQVKNWV